MALLLKLSLTTDHIIEEILLKNIIFSILGILGSR